MNAALTAPDGGSARKPSARRKKPADTPRTPEIVQRGPLNIDAILAETTGVDDMVEGYREQARTVVLGAKIDNWMKIKSDIRQSEAEITQLEAKKTNARGEFEKLKETQAKVLSAIAKLQKALDEAGERADKIEGTAQMREKLSKLQTALPGIEKGIEEKEATLRKTNEDIEQAQKRLGELETALQYHDFDEIREMADSTAKELHALQEEIEGEFSENVEKLHETSTTAEKMADDLLKDNMLTDPKLVKLADTIREAEKTRKPVADSPLVEITKNGDETTEIDISANAKRTLDMAVRFGLIAQETKDEILKNLNEFIDGAREATELIVRARKTREQINERYGKLLRGHDAPRGKRQQEAKPAESPRRRSGVKSILTPEEEARKRQARIDRDKKVPLPPKKGGRPAQRPSDAEKAQKTEAKTGNPAIKWMDTLKDPKKQKDLKAVSETYITEQGTVTMAMQDITNGQVTEGEVKVPPKGIFRIVIGSTPVGVVHVKIDEAGNPTNEVEKIVTLEGLEKDVADIVAQNDIGKKEIFKSVYDKATRTAGAQAISAKKREQSGDTTPEVTEK